MASRSPSDVPAERLAALNAGTAETRNLAEGLALHFPTLFATIIPSSDVAQLADLPITRRMAEAGRLLAESLPHPALTALGSHPSDTVRGALCYALARHTASLTGTLAAIRPLADDPHFGVREWAWMAARPSIAADLPAALSLLSGWSADPSPALRRFASEATRPRGVWCTQLRALVADPQPGLALLEPLRADPEKYVQDSVANWLNDASKSRPDWVRALCDRWTRESPGPHTARIVKRALRTLNR
jgi:3-methyladenine DNA glycosylase AlkC